MKKRVIIILLLGILLIFPLVQAQNQSQTYSGLNRFTDDVKLTFSGGDDKTRLALEIREKEVDSAINNIQNQEEDEAIKNLERARKKLQVVQEKVSLNTSEEIKTSVEEITDKINTEDDLPDEFEEYLLEEEKTHLIVVLTEKTFEYCTELAKEGYEEMLKEEVCNPETAVPGLEEELKELKDIQERLFVQLMLSIRSCIDDPGTCNCEDNVDIRQKAKCEKMVALAVKCEYKEDETACNELEAMRPLPGDSFATSFVPAFLMNLFAKKHYMIEYNITHSEGVPEECWDENDKPECEKYDDLKETELDWDEYGNFIGSRRGRGIPEPMPTIKEAFPECYNEEDMFLEECGDINIVWAEDGSINYIVDKQIDGIINDFENQSAQHTIDEGNWTIDEGVWEIKEEMNQIQNQIVNITYAPGTGPGGDGGVVVDGDDQGVSTDGDGGGGIDVDNVVTGDGDDGGMAPGTSGGAPDDTIVGDDLGGDDDGETVDSGIIDDAGDGVDEGPGEPDVVDED